MTVQEHDKTNIICFGEETKGTKVTNPKQLSRLSPGEDVFSRSQWPCGLRRGYWPVGCWDRGLNPAQGMDVCPRLSKLCCPV
jgi:hypothetical protein